MLRAAEKGTWGTAGHTAGLSCLLCTARVCDAGAQGTHCHCFCADGTSSN